MTNQWKLLLASLCIAALYTVATLYLGGYFNEKSVEYNIDFPEEE